MARLDIGYDNQGDCGRLPSRASHWLGLARDEANPQFTVTRNLSSKYGSPPAFPGIVPFGLNRSVVTAASYPFASGVGT